MASAIAHSAVALAAAAWLPKELRTGAVVGTGVALSVLPDADVVGFAMGIAYEQMLGHRGVSHSIPVALAAAWCLGWLYSMGSDVPRAARRLVAYFFVSLASHGVLDAMTNGGLGVAFLAPFSGRRFFFPWRPIQVSPIGLSRLSVERLGVILASEVVVLALPLLAVVVGALAWRRLAGIGWNRRGGV